MKYRNRFIKE